MEKDLIHIEEDDLVTQDQTHTLSPWKVLIIDDDEEVHSITKLVLKDFKWEGRKLAFLDAYTAADAIDILSHEPDIAVGLVDVVMETDDAGLQLIHKIRHELHNHSIRLVLRTGQPGQAPERTVIREYDVSDYKNKTELSGLKLDTLMCASLRAYKDIISLEKNRRGLETVISSAAKVYQSLSREKLAKDSLRHLQRLVEMNAELAFPQISGVAIYHHNGYFDILHCNGIYTDFNGLSIEQTMSDQSISLINQAVSQQKNIYTDDHLVLNLQGEKSDNLIFYIQGFGAVSAQDTCLLELFAANAETTFANGELKNQLQQSQRDITYYLADTLCPRNLNQKNQLYRLASVCELLASESGMSDHQTSLITSACAIFELSRTGLPESVFSDSAQISPAQWQLIARYLPVSAEVLQHHGGELLKRIGRITAGQLEKWDGTGFPAQCNGRDIPAEARIYCLANQLNTLLQANYQGNALEHALTHIQRQSGKEWQPELVDILLHKKAWLTELAERYPISVSGPA